MKQIVANRLQESNDLPEIAGKTAKIDILPFQAAIDSDDLTLRSSVNEFGRLGREAIRRVPRTSPTYSWDAAFIG